MNLLSLGVESVYPVGVLGNDPFGRELRLLLDNSHVDCSGLISQMRGGRHRLILSHAWKVRS